MEKTMTLNLRVNPTVKQQAEDVLKQLGIPMATAIDMYLRQITLTGGIPFSLSLPKAPAALNADTMTDGQLHEGRAEIEIAYTRGVAPEGNPVAVAAINEVFHTVDATWRGLGVIPGSGYAIRPEYAEFDAFQRFEPEVEPTQEPKGCRCGDVLRGMMAPNECPLFRKVCTPENPVGPCMVSSEGSCAAYYRYL